MDTEKSISVLTVEDDTGLRKSIAAYLEDSGFIVHEAACGRDGLEVFREFRPDIVFTDLSMPNGHGLDLIPALRKESPHTPIVVISGAGTLTDAVEAMKLGAWDYISKPVRELSILEDLSRRLLEQARVFREREATLEQVERTLKNHMKYDPLTGLPNRVMLAGCFSDLACSERSLSLILLDLDNFKMANTTFGHATANELLRKVAERLKACLSGSDFIAHIGRDEFAILSKSYDKELEKLVANLTAIFHDPFTVEGKESFFTASMGIVSFPGDGETIEELLGNAEISLSKAKTNGLNSVQIYTSAIGSTFRNCLEMEASLRRALERNEFTLMYQPQIDVASGVICGVEALVRWQRPDGQLVLPSDFIPSLEKSGQIIPVGELILKNACSQYVDWRFQGIPPLTLSVNISARQFKSKGLPDTVVRILAETGMDPSCLCLELTESIVMEDVEETLVTLQKLRNLGIHLSIDDFGTGYSSLSYLGRMPISELKIDRSFIATIPNDQVNAAIVNTIISMANSMNIRVVAEGVETGEQLDHLTSRQCQTAQGFYFSRPLTFSAFSELVRSR